MPRANNCTFIGHLGRDPEVKQVGEHTVAEFSIGVSSWRKGAETTWIRVSAWRKQADYATKYLGKGDAVYVQGELTVRDYTKKDGTPGYSVELNASELQGLTRRDTAPATDSMPF